MNESLVRDTDTAADVPVNTVVRTFAQREPSVSNTRRAAIEALRAHRDRLEAALPTAPNTPWGYRANQHDIQHEHELVSALLRDLLTRDTDG